ncbi:hypothetical protein [Paenibacillus aquistagni]|uniref:Uncharacterized protein n=1 Tax=Paenibacillus aquistagni TaxID=1852522 RepID=A0A1X7IA73_9BACL|nr:hypothetical protein [Paenibacillus aquistagni]NMM51626.1 hypothetical protein [Paenibacillus aquistagni]SMG10927.1 hypothetical protein SAMN06295960_0225 [Paenibacillus aquistagni]
MKRYNEKILADTKKLAQQSVDKAMHSAAHLTKPPRHVARAGSVIGGIAGGILLVVGGVCLLLQYHTAAWVTLVAGATTIVSNRLNYKRNQ